MNIGSTAKQPNLLLESAVVPLDLYIQFQFRKHRQKSFQDSVSILENIRSDHTLPTAVYHSRSALQLKTVQKHKEIKYNN